MVCLDRRKENKKGKNTDDNVFFLIGDKERKKREKH